MKKVTLLLLLVLLHLPMAAGAALTIEITSGAEDALPIAIVPFGGPVTASGQDVASIVRADLERSGRFKPMPVEDMLAKPKTESEISFKDWRSQGMDNLVVGQVQDDGKGGYQIRFQLFDTVTGKSLVGYNVPSSKRDLRVSAHRIADIIYEKLTGMRGAFATRVAYITSINKSKGQQQIMLKVADADGYDSQTIVTSKEPLMSPAWSPDGRRLAYVSFEKKRPSIYVQEVFTGKRIKVTSYPGINGAPAWSPDGRKLALTLSKDGNPDVYVLNLASRSLTRLTRHYAIDTEPAWSPDGRHIVFTSDRGGKPQIYRVSASGGGIERVTYEGDYNARASYSPDGKSLTMVTRMGGKFRIGLLDLGNRVLQVLSGGRLDESPSFAPNGGMIIYATKIRGVGELAAVSVDGRVRQRLALQAGDVREPAWSPYSQSQKRN
jgi:TolB protein